MSGEISNEDAFAKELRIFHALSEKVNDTWLIRSVKTGDLDTLYLQKTSLVKIHRNGCDQEDICYDNYSVCPVHQYGECDVACSQTERGCNVPDALISQTKKVYSVPDAPINMLEQGCTVLGASSEQIERQCCVTSVPSRISNPQANVPDNACSIHLWEDQDMGTDNQLGPGSSESETIQFEYHIVYSASYCVPVLYFNCYTAGGELLSLADVWALVPKHYRRHLKEHSWSMLTQQEHPLLGRPFFQLHPCHTASLMMDLCHQTHNYLLSWLSAVGPLVLLKLPLTYLTMAIQGTD